jgi:hypothetical protein
MSYSVTAEARGRILFGYGGGSDLGERLVFSIVVYCVIYFLTVIIFPVNGVNDLELYTFVVFDVFLCILRSTTAGI